MVVNTEGLGNVARIGETSDLLKCSFCGKSQKQVKKLIAGPGVYICNECIDVCANILEKELGGARAKGKSAAVQRAKPLVRLSCLR